MTPRRLVESLLDEKPVVMKDRVVKDADMICPHCEELIHEKGIFQQNGKWVHGACGGVIRLKEPSAEAKKWLDSFTRQTD